MLRPGTPAPSLKFDTLRHGSLDLTAGAPAGGTYVSFLRGTHCKWTRFHAKELDDRIGDFALRGVRVIAAITQGKEAAEALVERMQLIRLPVAYNLDPRGLAADWGLYLTEASTEEEAPALHIEPAQVWIKQDGTIGAIAVQSGPNLWADATQTIRNIENTMSKFPERGAAQ